MKIKDGASVEKMTDRMRVACAAIEDCYATFGADCVLTSGDETTTTHKGRPVAGDTVDPHYLGKAADFSIHAVPADKRQALVDMIEQDLGPEFYVDYETDLLDKDGNLKRAAHLHVQDGHVIP